MFIQTEQTPNPATLKFLPGKPVMAGGMAEFTDPEAAGRASPLASRLFGVEGVTGVYLGGDFVSVTKAEGQDWHRAQARRAGRHHGALPVRRPGGRPGGSPR